MKKSNLIDYVITVIFVIVLLGSGTYIVSTMIQNHMYQVKMYDPHYVNEELFGLKPVYDEDGEVMYWNTSGLAN